MKKKKKNKWQNKVTKKQIKHIRETTDRCTLSELISNIRRQRTSGIRCWECEEIVHRLGLDITQEGTNEGHKEKRVSC